MPTPTSISGNNRGVVAVPFAASLGWYSQWVDSRLNGRRRPGLTKHPNRCLISDGVSQRLLTVPVVGGGHHLAYHLREGDVALADHGSWRREHLGAWNSIYGRAPYFEHIHDRLVEIYNPEKVSTLGEMCREMHGLVVGMLPLDADLENVDRRILDGYIPQDAEKELSMLHWLLHRGPEAIFTLLAALL